jgi:hypothetical protein
VPTAGAGDGDRAAPPRGSAARAPPPIRVILELAGRRYGAIAGQAGGVASRDRTRSIQGVGGESMVFFSFACCASSVQ